MSALPVLGLRAFGITFPERASGAGRDPATLPRRGRGAEPCGRRDALHDALREASNAFAQFWVLGLAFASR